MFRAVINKVKTLIPASVSAIEPARKKALTGLLIPAEKMAVLGF
jgi:hypothetical protein